MNLRLFNPSCELEVVNGNRYYNPPKFPLVLESDLDVLPMYFSNKNDCLLVDDIPEIDNFLLEIYKPEFVLKSELKNLKTKKLDNFLPWGISPRAYNFVDNISENFSSEFLQSPIGKYNPKFHKHLFSRKTSARVFEIFIDIFGDENFFPSKNQLPTEIYDTPTALEFFNKKFKNENGAVFKAPMSSSGRGIQMFRKQIIDDNFKNWLKFIFRTQGFVMCEPLFDKKNDFSLHFKIKNQQLQFVGVSVFSTSNNGFYLGSVAKKYNAIPDFTEDFTNQLIEKIKVVLQNSDYCKNYDGYLGIDGITYYESGRLKINPFVEINCRHSMGLLSIMLEKFSLSENPAKFIIIQRPDFDKYLSQLPKINSNGKLVNGFLELTDKKSEHFKAGIFV